MKHSKLIVAAVALLFSVALVHAQDKDHDRPRFNPNAGFLGAKFGPVDDDAAERLKLESHAGVVVIELISASPAEKGGMKVDDVIQKIDGADVDGVEGFVAIMMKSKPQQAMKFSIFRDGKQQDLNITLGTRPADMNRPDDGDKKDKDGDKDSDHDKDGGK